MFQQMALALIKFLGTKVIPSSSGAKESFETNLGIIIKDEHESMKETALNWVVQEDKEKAANLEWKRFTIKELNWLTGQRYYGICASLFRPLLFAWIRFRSLNLGGAWLLWTGLSAKSCSIYHLNPWSVTDSWIRRICFWRWVIADDTRSRVFCTNLSQPLHRS